MSKVTHLSDVNALLRHAGIAELKYQDFSKPPLAADDTDPPAAPAVEAPVTPPVEARALPAVPVAAAPAPMAIPTPSPLKAAVNPVVAPMVAAAPLNSTFDRLRRKAVSRRSQLAGFVLSLPARAPVQLRNAKVSLADKSWPEIWAALSPRGRD